MEAQMVPAAVPVRLDLNAPLEVARWRALVHWVLAIPHLLVIYFLEIGRNVCTLIGFFAILFTKRFPAGLHRFSVLTMRYEWRVGSYVLFMRESYPPFDFSATSEDESGDPASFSVDYPAELSRFLPLVKWLLAIPHYIVLMILFVGALFAWVGAFFAVLFTGKYPAGMRNYLIGVNRWVNRVYAYVYLLRDEYPPFSLD